MSDEVLRKWCDKNYHQLLPLIAEKMQKEKEQKDRLNAVKARLIYGQESGVKIISHEESASTQNSKHQTGEQNPKKGSEAGIHRSPSPHASEQFTSLRCSDRSSAKSPQAQRTDVGIRRRQQRQTPSRATSQYSESKDSEGGHWKSKSRRQKSNTYEDDLYQKLDRVRKDIPSHYDIRHFSLPEDRMPQTCQIITTEAENPEDHLKLFQSWPLNRTEGWAMPTWCHMFNSTLTGNARVWFDKLPKESIDSYEDLRTAFRENYLQQTKHIKDPVEIHHIKQKDKESTEDFMERYKAEVLDVEGDVVAALSQLAEKHFFMENRQRVGTTEFQEKTSKQTRTDRKQIDYHCLTKRSKEIFALGKSGKFKAPTTMHAMSFPPLSEEDGTESPMIIEVEMGGHFVHRVYIDGGASSEVFGRQRPFGVGHDALLVKIGDEAHSTSAWMNFMVIRKIRAVPSTAHGMLKFPVEGGTNPPGVPEQTIAIGSTLTEKGRKELCALLKQNLDIFAWKPVDMTGIPRNIAEHCLNIPGLGYSPVRQKKRGQAPKRNKAIQEEVAKLVDAGIMKEQCPKGLLSITGNRLEGWEVPLWGRIFFGYKYSTNGLKACPDRDAVTSDLPSRLIAEIATLTAPRERARKELIIYFAAAKEAISAVLMTDREGRQIPVYFVSRTLRGPEVYRKFIYPVLKWLVLALLSASKRLKRYFQAHTVIVITSQPIKQLLSSLEISERMLKWKFELEGYDIQYRPRTRIKGQILAVFIVENDRREEESPPPQDELMAEPEALPEPWTLFTDGSSCVDGSGAGLILTNPEGAEFTYAMRFRFEATNNEAEYEALIAGLRVASKWV
ncbi:reverse transcriptase domain-containing protein [Tanacetum coccineum]